MTTTAATASSPPNAVVPPSRSASSGSTRALTEHQVHHQAGSDQRPASRRPEERFGHSVLEHQVALEQLRSPSRSCRSPVRVEQCHRRRAQHPGDYIGAAASGSSCCSTLGSRTSTEPSATAARRPRRRRTPRASPWPPLAVPRPRARVRLHAVAGPGRAADAGQAGRVGPGARARRGPRSPRCRREALERQSRSRSPLGRLEVGRVVGKRSRHSPPPRSRVADPAQRPDRRVVIRRYRPGPPRPDEVEAAPAAGALRWPRTCRSRPSRSSRRCRCRRRPRAGWPVPPPHAAAPRRSSCWPFGCWPPGGVHAHAAGPFAVTVASKRPVPSAVVPVASSCVTAHVAAAPPTAPRPRPTTRAPTAASTAADPRVPGLLAAAAAAPPVRRVRRVRRRHRLVQRPAPGRPDAAPVTFVRTSPRRARGGAGHGRLLVSGGGGSAGSGSSRSATGSQYSSAWKRPARPSGAHPVAGLCPACPATSWRICRTARRTRTGSTWTHLHAHHHHGPMTTTTAAARRY